MKEPFEDWVLNWYIRAGLEEDDFDTKRYHEDALKEYNNQCKIWKKVDKTITSTYMNFEDWIIDFPELLSKGMYGAAIEHDKVYGLDMPPYKGINLPEGHFITKYVKWARARTDTHVEYHLPGALFVLSSICNPSNYLYLGSNKRFKPNLWLMICGDSGTSRKSTIRNFAEELLKDRVNLLPDSGSPQAMQETIAEHGACGAFILNECHGKIAEMNQKGRTNYRAMYIDMFDGKDINRLLTQKKGVKTEFVTKGGIYITALWLGIKEIIVKEADPNDVISGFYYRFIVVSPDNWKPYRGIVINTEEIDKRFDELKEHLDLIQERLIESPLFTISNDALDDWNRVMSRANLSNDKNYKSTMVRIGDNVLKMAMLVALGDEVPTTDVTKEHIAKAMEFGSLFRKNTQQMFQEIIEFPNDEVLTKMCAFLKDNRWVTRSELYSHLRVSSNIIEEKLEILKRMEVLEEGESDGKRRSKIYRMTN